MNTVTPLPYSLEFTSAAGGMLDKDGEGTGFSHVEPNSFGNEYQPALIDLSTAEGVLRITSAGNATNGGSYDFDNSLVNGVRTTFDATLGAFTINTRLTGPLSYLDRTVEQGGIVFGPDQDNYVKLAAIFAGSNKGQQLQFIDEQLTGSTITHAIAVQDSYTNIGNFANISVLDLRITADPVTGKISGYYRVNFTDYIKIKQEVTLTGAKKDEFFSGLSRAGLIAIHKNNTGPVTVTFDRFEIVPGTPITSRPTVTATRPANGESNVRRDIFIGADVRLPTAGHGIDADTLNANHVRLIKVSNGRQVEAELNTSGGGDAVVLTPRALLEPNTLYRFEITEGLQDTNGAAFIPYITNFTTGANVGVTDAAVAFEQVPQASSSGFYTGLTVGPDGKLYASTIDGRIQRFTINPDGSLQLPQTISTIQQNNGGARLISGIAFDPGATANNLVLWVGHSQFAFENATDFTGKVTRLSGQGLATYEDYIVNLPRAIRDHVNNQIAFDSAGAMYFAQGANTAMGAPDNAWGQRPERMLSAAVLKVNVGAIAQRIAGGNGPLDVKTVDSGGTYDPFAPGAPLKIFASGVRNAYDLVWHPNGNLYVPTNGSASGGSTPATSTPIGSGLPRIDSVLNGPYTGPAVPGLAPNNQTEPDWLFKVTEGGYYGHPNPVRNEYVLNGANPTSLADPFQVNAYPVGTQPDRNYRINDVFSLGTNESPNGVIVYGGNQFNGILNNALLIARYSGSDDIVVLKPGANGQIAETLTGITGFTKLADPLDIAQDPTTGFLYVSETGPDAMRITLLRPIPPGATATVNKPRFLFTEPRGGAASPAQTITIKNTGTSTLSIASAGLSVVGTAAGLFQLQNTPILPLNVVPGDSVSFQVVFNPISSTATGVQTASLRIRSNDQTSTQIDIPLRGLVTTGSSGSGEPSLQRVVDLYGYAINVGDTNPSDTPLYTSSVPMSAGSQEVVAQRFIRADPTKPVRIEPLAVYGVASVPAALEFGIYTSGKPEEKMPLFAVATNDNQTVNPVPIGSTVFDPGSGEFGLYGTYAGFRNSDGFYRDSHSEDGLNAIFESNNVFDQRKIRFYPVPGESNTYLFAIEETGNASTRSYDYQDVVGIIRNVTISHSGPEIAVFNSDNLALQDTLTFNKVGMLDPTSPNVTHDRIDVTVRNTGTAALNIASLNITGPFTILNQASLPGSVAPGAAIILQLQFVATGNNPNSLDPNPNDTVTYKPGHWFGNLTISTNDPETPNVVLSLRGFWQPQSELNFEPELQDLVLDYNLSTQVLYNNQLMNTAGAISTRGEEILSPYWQRADNNYPITVRQLSAFHTQGNTANTRWHVKGSTTRTTIFNHINLDAQSYLPRRSTTSSPFTTLGYVNTGSVIGFAIDGEWSDDSLNTSGDPGHHVRFYPARNSVGQLIPNTYLMAMDYSGINYDYNDNVYLISNIRPELIPGMPINTAAYGTAGGNVLTWAPHVAMDFAGYNVYRSSSINGTYTKLNTATLLDPTYADTTAPAGVEVFYRVSVNNMAGTEGLPATMKATRTLSQVLPPSAPQNINATSISAGRVSVTWNDVSGETSYRIERSSNLGQTWNTIGAANSNGTSFADLTTLANTTYQYRVFAANDAGESPASGVAAATTPGNVPGNPTNLFAFTISQTQIDLSWTDIDGETGYKVQRSPDNVIWTEIGQRNIDVTTFSDTTAQPGTFYFYRVVAFNSAGESGFSNTATAATQGAPPLAPVSLSSTPISGARIDLLWANVANETGFVIERTSGLGDGNAIWQQVGQVGPDVTTYSDLTVAPSTTYTYRVRAFNGTGPSANSPTSTATTPSSAPSAPASLNASAAGTSAINLSWSDVQGETVFKIERSLNGTTGWTEIATRPTDVLVYQDTGLNPSTLYFYRVRAGNTSGDSNYSPTASATTSSTTAPIPTNFVATTQSAFAINLAWTDVAGETGYRIQFSRNGNVWTTLTTLAADSTSFLSQFLVPGTTYFYRIQSIGAIADSAFVTPVSATTSGIATASPVRVNSAGPVFVDSLAQTWSADTGFIGGTASTVSYAVANTIDDQLYFQRRFGNFSYALPVTNGTYTLKLYFAEPSFTTTNKRKFDVTAEGSLILDDYDIRTDSASYRTAVVKTFSNVAISDGTFNLQFTNVLDNALVSAIELIPNSAPVPATPTGPAAVAQSTSSINFSWNSVANAVSYEIERTSDGGTNWQLLTAVSSSTLNVLDTGLAQATTYGYRVRAVSTGGVSAFTGIVSATTQGSPLQPPAAPTGLDATATGTTTIDLVWNDVTLETGYVIERSADGTNGWTEIGQNPADDTTYTDSTVAANQTRFYRVKARNLVGDSQPSNTDSGTTPSGSVATPGNFAAAPTSFSTIDLSWSDVTGETGYRVQWSRDGNVWADLPTLAADTTSLVAQYLAPSSTYFFRIQALGLGGNSTYTAPLSPTTPAAPIGTSTVRINAGGPIFTSGVTTWVADTGFTGGTASNVSFAVGNTLDDPLYFGRRFGANFSYAISVTNGQYSLRLHFTETSLKAANLRKFDVFAEGRLIIDDLDIWAESGYRTALVKTNDVFVTDGVLNLSLVSSIDNAIISGIELISQANAAPTTPLSPAAAAQGPTTARFTWAASPAAFGYEIERSLDAGTTWSLFRSVPSTSTLFDDTGLSTGVTYSYRIRATGPGGASGYSGVASVTL